MKLKELLKNGILLTDGAMGTYYRSIGGICEMSEEANLKQPSLIEDIHRQYIKAGARLIRTNTFAANTAALGCDMPHVGEILSAAYTAAKNAAAGSDAVIAADIGPGADAAEYREAVDIWLSLGADTFVLETFTEPNTPAEVAAYIRSRAPESFIHVSYALTDTGHTKNSYHADTLLSLSDNDPNIDSVGFNCGVGPLHMLGILKKLGRHSKPLFVQPNSGYPEMINGRVSYVPNPDYFADTLSESTAYGISAAGGCCGTTPEHIVCLGKRLYGEAPSCEAKRSADTANNSSAVIESTFAKKLRAGKFVVAVELDPPFKPDSGKIIEGARILNDAGADIITMADSPMGKSRADSVITSLKIKRETGAEVLPHICCRDKNSVALRSLLIGAYMEGIRNVLVVTGDPVPGENRADVKSVFNMNSYTLTDMISRMNESVFDEGSICIGGAVNFNVSNKENELKRLLKKHRNGAYFFLTQPIFDDAAIDFIASLPKDRDYKILAGIMPPVSYKNINFLNNELAGVNIPQDIVKRFDPDMTREEAQKTGELIACEIIAKVKEHADGLYIIAPFNRCQMISSIIKNAL